MLKKRGCQKSNYLYNHTKLTTSGRSLVVKLQPSKLITGVRFSPPAPINAKAQLNDNSGGALFYCFT